ncbi:hypothetical protein Dimus_032085 [Dionaea muscipula]
MAASQQFFPEPTPPQKLRLLCSYGGHIAPHPHGKALCYVGGETRSGSGPEAIILETSSSFGSTGSSASLTNFPATRVGEEEGNGNGTSASLDLKGTLAPVDSIGRVLAKERI